MQVQFFKWYKIMLLHCHLVTVSAANTLFDTPLIVNVTSTIANSKFVITGFKYLWKPTSTSNDIII